MTKIYIKLIAMALALILSVSVVIMSSYAWLVLAGNPVATGIQVAIGGGNTILTAPNITDGTHNYPGHFSDRLNFGQQTNYAYLQELGSLTPVSTYNGVDWFLPAYYSGSDEEVQQGKIPSGALKDISEFKRDSELSHANLSIQDQAMIDEGSYIYLDFWVVSPGGDYNLRVSTDTGASAGGSFVIDLMEPEMTDKGYKLKASEASAAAAVRVGFLANDVMLTDDTMLKYTQSPYHDERFTALRGLYQEPNTGTAYIDANRFTIYEPNGDLHPQDPDNNGKYLETKPLALKDEEIVEERIRDRLTVQRTSTWAMTANGQTLLEEKFQTALYSGIWDKMKATDVMNSFFGKYMQGQLSSCVDKGYFISNTNNLYAMLGPMSLPVAAEQLIDENEPGATDDVYIIKLERNVPQRIRMFIWLEGQDADCVDEVNSARFAVNIELAGGNT